MEELLFVCVFLFSRVSVFQLANALQLHLFFCFILLLLDDFFECERKKGVKNYQLICFSVAISCGTNQLLFFTGQKCKSIQFRCPVAAPIYDFCFTTLMLLFFYFGAQVFFVCNFSSVFRSTFSSLSLRAFFYCCFCTCNEIKIFLSHLCFFFNSNFPHSVQVSNGRNEADEARRADGRMRLILFEKNFPRIAIKRVLKSTREQITVGDKPLRKSKIGPH